MCRSTANSSLPGPSRVTYGAVRPQPEQSLEEDVPTTGWTDTALAEANRSTRTTRLDRAAVAALIVTVVALALRLWHLSFQSLWWDEGVSIYLSGAGVRALTIGKDFAVDLHPPGYHLALAAWRVLLGPSVFSDRLFSALCGTLTIPLSYALVRTITYRLGAPPERYGKHTTSPSPSPMERGPGGEAAFLAAVLAAISPIDVYYSQ